MFVGTQIFEIFSKKIRAYMGAPRNSGPIFFKFNQYNYTYKKRIETKFQASRCSNFQDILKK